MLARNVSNKERKIQMNKFNLRVTLIYKNKTQTVREIVHHAPKKQSAHEVLQELESVYMKRTHIETVEIEVKSITEIKEDK